MNRIVVAVATAEALYYGMEWRELGFPDGHLTDLDRFQDRAYPVFMAVFLVLAAYALRKRTGRSAAIGLLVISTLAVSAGIIAAQNLDHGGGG